jgi:hypothetical protein
MEINKNVMKILLEDLLSLAFLSSLMQMEEKFAYFDAQLKLLFFFGSHINYQFKKITSITDATAQFCLEM